ERDPVRPTQRRFHGPHFVPPFADPHERLLRELLGHVAIPRHQAQRADQSRPRLPAEAGELWSSPHRGERRTKVPPGFARCLALQRCRDVRPRQLRTSGSSAGRSHPYPESMGRREPRRWARAALSALALTAGGMALSACILPPPPPPLVVVYGDSILSESQAYLSDALASTGWQVQIHAFPGTGLCDWMQTMATEDTSSRIKLVIVMHTGNWGSTVPWCTDSDW